MAGDLAVVRPAVRIERNHLCYGMPILIDARLKPGFPRELVCDEATEQLVTRRWNEYFPDGMEMGDSRQGHLDKP